MTMNLEEDYRKRLTAWVVEHGVDPDRIPYEFTVTDHCNGLASIVDIFGVRHTFTMRRPVPRPRGRWPRQPEPYKNVTALSCDCCSTTWRRTHREGQPDLWVPDNAGELRAREWWPLYVDHAPLTEVVED